MGDSPQPPLDDRTSGVNVPCSTSKMCFSGSPFPLLMPPVADFSGGRAVRGGVGVEDSDVKVGASFAFIPESLSCMLQ